PSSRARGSACRAGAWLLDLDAHGAGRALDDLRGLIEVERVQVWHLRLRDLPDLGRCDPPDLLAVRLAGALLDPGSLLDQHRGGRRLRDEGERPVLVDRDLDRDDAPVLVLRLG